MRISHLQDREIMAMLDGADHKGGRARTTALKHLKECAGCSSRAANMVELYDQLATDSTPNLSPGFSKNVMKKIYLKPFNSPVFKFSVPLARFNNQGFEGKTLFEGGQFAGCDHLGQHRCFQAGALNCGSRFLFSGCSVFRRWHLGARCAASAQE